MYGDIRVRVPNPDVFNAPRQSSTSPVSPLGFEIFENGCLPKPGLGGQYLSNLETGVRQELAKPSCIIQSQYNTHNPQDGLLKPKVTPGTLRFLSGQNSYVLSDQQFAQYSSANNASRTASELETAPYVPIVQSQYRHSTPALPTFLGQPALTSTPFTNHSQQVPCLSRPESFYDSAHASSLMALTSFRTHSQLQQCQVEAARRFLSQEGASAGSPKTSSENVEVDFVAREALSSLEAAVAKEAAYARKSEGCLLDSQQSKNSRSLKSVAHKQVHNTDKLKRSESLGDLFIETEAPLSTDRSPSFDSEDKVVVDAASALEEALKREASAHPAPHRKHPHRLGKSNLQPSKPHPKEISRQEVELLLPDEIDGSVETEAFPIHADGYYAYQSFFPEHGYSLLEGTISPEQGFMYYHEGVETTGKVSGGEMWNMEKSGYCNSVELSVSACEFVPSVEVKEEPRMRPLAESSREGFGSTFSLGEKEEEDFSRFLGELSVQNLMLKVDTK